MNEDISNDESKFCLNLALFPYVYFGVGSLYSLFDIFALGNYEPKDGQWGSFKIHLLLNGFAACVAFICYLIGIMKLVETAARRLPRRRFALINVTSAFLSWVVPIIIGIIAPDMWSEFFWLGILCLTPPLLGVLLVKSGQGRQAGHPLTRR